MDKFDIGLKDLIDVGSTRPTIYKRSALNAEDQAFLNELIGTHEVPAPKPSPMMLKMLHNASFQSASLVPEDVGATGSIEVVKKPFERKPHLTHSLKNHEGLAALRKQQTEKMHADREEHRKNHQSNKR